MLLAQAFGLRCFISGSRPFVSANTTALFPKLFLYLASGRCLAKVPEAAMRFLVHDRWAGQVA
jgi:hypothetical protein